MNEPIGDAAPEPCCQDFERCRLKCCPRADYWQSKYERAVAPLNAAEAECDRLVKWLTAHPELWPCMSGSPVDVAIAILSKRVAPLNAPSAQQNAAAQEPVVQDAMRAQGHNDPVAAAPCCTDWTACQVPCTPRADYWRALYFDKQIHAPANAPSDSNALQEHPNTLGNLTERPGYERLRVGVAADFDMGDPATRTLALGFYWQDKARALQDEVMRTWFVLKDAGKHPGRTDDLLHEVVRRALLQTSSAADRWRNPELAASETPKAQEGTWTLVAPDGRRFTAPSPIKCCAAESNQRIPPAVALARIARGLDEDAAAEAPGSDKPEKSDSPKRGLDPAAGQQTLGEKPAET